MSRVARKSPNERLRRERLRRGWSREYVAEQIGVADAKTIGRWERGVAFPRAYFVQKLCALFGIFAQDLGLYQEEGDGSFPVKIQPPPQEHSLSLSILPLYDSVISSQPAGGSVGRDGLLTMLKQRLCGSKSSNVSALYGLPGVGKTGLAIEVVHDRDVQRHFSDGVLWTRLGSKPDICELLRTWGTLLGCPAAEMATAHETDWARIICSTIGTRRMLLVIDDAWRCEDALAFLVGGPYCACLLTTRIPSVAFLVASDGAILVPCETAQFFSGGYTALQQEAVKVLV